ncbi:hypothetical protein QTP88_003299 [Uroleucon formosanum]
MKKKKAVGPDGVPAEVWKILENVSIRWLKGLFKKVLMEGKMPEVWRKSFIVPIYKGKGDIQECGNYRGIKLMILSVKIWGKYYREGNKKICMITRVLASSMCGVTEDFKVGVGVHEASALSPYLFSVVMDELTKEIQGEVPWCMMFADDIGLIEENVEDVNNRLNEWSPVLQFQQNLQSQFSSKCNQLLEIFNDAHLWKGLENPDSNLPKPRRCVSLPTLGLRTISTSKASEIGLKSTPNIMLPAVDNLRENVKKPSENCYVQCLPAHKKSPSLPNVALRANPAGDASEVGVPSVTYAELPVSNDSLCAETCMPCMVTSMPPASTSEDK